MKEKANSAKRQVEQKRKRESILLEELCRNHGYMFADSLPGMQILEGRNAKAKAKAP